MVVPVPASHHLPLEVVTGRDTARPLDCSADWRKRETSTRIVSSDLLRRFFHHDYTDLLHVIICKINHLYWVCYCFYKVSSH